QGALKQAGIASSVHRFSRYRAMGGGGYTLKTSPDDKARAERIIRSKQTAVDLDEYVDPGDTSYRRCPACGSANVAGGGFTWPQLLIGVCTLGAGLILAHRPWHCAKCGHAWRGR